MDKLLREIEDDILRIKTRLAYLVPIEKALRDITGTRSYPIKNDIIYKMVIDSYDMVVIDLASLCRGMLGKGGFFNRLNSHLKKLRRANLKTIKTPEGQILSDSPMTDQERGLLEESIREDFRQSAKQALDNAFDRLFPPRIPKRRCWLLRLFCSAPKAAPVDKVTQADIQHLKDRFEQLVNEVIRDRDARRAHRYEKKKSDDGVQKLSLDSLTKHFEQIEQIINDLRALTLGGHFIYHPPTHANPETVAKDLTELIFIGSHQLVFHAFQIDSLLKAYGAPRPYYWQLREDFYRRFWIRRLLDILRKRASQ